MKFIQKDDNGHVIAASDIKYEGFVDSTENYEVGFDGKLYSETEMQSAEYLLRKNKYESDLNLNNIRARREMECFSIINRGELWYNKLSEEQKTELLTWYEAWLDAPQTGIVPEKLEWIK